MATSDHQYLPTLCDLIVTRKPRRILDIGIGFGKNGFLCREYSELWRPQPSVAPGGWTTRIDGIEAHEPYIQIWHRALYDDIHIGDARDILPTLDSYDAIIATDVLEHLRKVDAIGMLNIMREKSAWFLTTTPRMFKRQGAVAGNKYERHLSLLEPGTLLTYGNVLKLAKVNVLIGEGQATKKEDRT